MIFFGRIFYFQQWRSSWLGAGSSDTILKGGHPSTTNLAKFNRILQNQIFTLVAARLTFVYVVRCVVSTVLNTALRPLDLWFGWLVHFKVHYQKSQSKMFWVILCAYLLIKDEVLLTVSWWGNYLLFWMNCVADLLWRSFYLSRSSIGSFVERDFFIRILLNVYFDFA
jgi:hypothetical protein